MNNDLPKDFRKPMENYPSFGLEQSPDMIKPKSLIGSGQKALALNYMTHNSNARLKDHELIGNTIMFDQILNEEREKRRNQVGEKKTPFS